MRIGRLAVVLLVLVVGAVAPQRVTAATYVSLATYQAMGLPCGEITKENRASHAGGNYVAYTVGTVGSADVCGQWFVYVSGIVNGVAGSASEGSGFYSVYRSRSVQVPRYGTTYVVTGRHRATTVLGFYVVDAWSQDDAFVPAPQQASSSPPAECATDPAWSELCTPLLIDTAADGFRLTTAKKGVLFDIDADGDLDLTAWTEADSDDAWVAMDRNGNGRIDDGRELFGGVTPVFADRTESAPNGFDAMGFLEWESAPAAVNEVIDAHDPAFARLLLWRDVNHNGISEPEELQSAAAAGLVAIDLNYQVRAKAFKPTKGSTIRLESIARWVDGTRAIVDVWLGTEE